MKIPLKIVVASMILSAFPLRAYNTLLPSCGLNGSIAPYVDKDGFVNPVILLGTVDFGQGLNLPLTLNFSSKTRAPSPEFGQGWECPLFESKIVDVQQDLKKVELFGGSTIYLVYNKREDTWKHYYSDSWTGKARGDDFDLTFVTGVVFSFHKGLISSMAMPNGRVIAWNRDGDKLISLSEIGKSTALKITYDNLGFAKQMLIKPDSFGASKEFYNLETSLVYAGTDKISCPGGRYITLQQSHDKALNPSLTWSDTSGPTEELIWDRTTGKITNDDKYLYKFVDTSKDGSSPKMFRTSKLTKKTESYYFDINRGIKDQSFVDGSSRHEETIMSPGLTFRIVRLIQETKKGITHNILRRSFDEQGHLLMEATGLANGKEQVKQYIYDDGGRVVSYLFNGREIWKNVYDQATGRLVSHLLDGPDVTVNFDSLPGGEMNETVRKSGGKALSNQKLTAAQWQAAAASMQRVD